jgi:hypothetical protein
VKRTKLTKRELEALAVLLKDWLEARGGMGRVDEAAGYFGVGKLQVRAAARILHMHVVGGIITLVQPPDKGHA